MRKRLLLTGVTGLVGSSVVVALVRDRREYEFVCLVRGGGGVSARERAAAALREECAFEGCLELTDEVQSRISVVECDISTMDPASLAADPALAGVEEVFHCAADVNLGKDPSGRVVRANYVGTEKIVALIGKPAVGETYHLTGDSPVSVAQIGEAVREVMGIDGIAAGPGAADETAEGRMFSRFIGDLFPYFSCEVEFAQDRIRRDWPACADWTYGTEELKRMIAAYQRRAF